MHNQEWEMDPQEVALYFRNGFREARDGALKDAEGYQQILFVLERLGAYMLEEGCCEERELQEEKCCEGNEDKEAKGLDAYKECLIALVKKHHPLEKHRKKKSKWISLYRDSHTAFGSLYEMVMHGRNDALHQGAFARTLTLHLVKVALFLEDALMAIMGSKIKDYMVQNPVYAYAWQPVSFVRQMMLANSFSYIPVYMKKKKCAGEKAWHIIAAHDIAKYLQSAKGNSRGKLLAKSIEEAIGPAIEEAFPAYPDESVKTILGRYAKKGAEGKPILVVKQDNCDELLGIATPFDLM